MEIVKRKSGRPKKLEEDKVKYQRIAVYANDYEQLVQKLERTNTQITDAFTVIVKSYLKR